MFIEQAINVILPLTVCINWKCLILQVKHSLEIWFTELCIHKEKTQTSLCVGSGISFHSDFLSTININIRTIKQSLV